MDYGHIICENKKLNKLNEFHHHHSVIKEGRESSQELKKLLITKQDETSSNSDNQSNKITKIEINKKSITRDTTISGGSIKIAQKRTPKIRPIATRDTSFNEHITNTAIQTTHDNLVKKRKNDKSMDILLPSQPLILNDFKKNTSAIKRDVTKSPISNYKQLKTQISTLSIKKSVDKSPMARLKSFDKIKK